MGPSGPIGLNMLAVNQAMKDYGVAEDEVIDFSMTVRRIAGIIISTQMQEAAEKSK